MQIVSGSVVVSSGMAVGEMWSPLDGDVVASGS